MKPRNGLRDGALGSELQKCVTLDVARAQPRQEDTGDVAARREESAQRVDGRVPWNRLNVDRTRIAHCLWRQLVETSDARAIVGHLERRDGAECGAHLGLVVRQCTHALEARQHAHVYLTSSCAQRDNEMAMSLERS
eukprot:3160303-Pleurochrysis_carterae.AAC.1